MESTNSISNEVAAAVIADKCRADQGLARRLQADGKAALSSLSERALADDLSVSVVRNAPGQVHVVLPDYAFQKSKQQNPLTDEQMAEIAGGEIFFTVFAVVAGVGLAASAAGAAAAIATSIKT